MRGPRMVESWIVDCELWMVDGGWWMVDGGLWMVDGGWWMVDGGLWMRESLTFRTSRIGGEGRGGFSINFSLDPTRP